VEVARVNCERAIHDASIKFGMRIKRVEWSPDYTAAKVSGLGFALDMWYDEEAVHAIGEVPGFAKLLVGPLGRFFQKTFQRQLPG
jgi:ribosome-binding factor A